MDDFNADLSDRRTIKAVLVALLALLLLGALAGWL